jgi:hypothetical protein
MIGEASQPCGFIFYIKTNNTLQKGDYIIEEGKLLENTQSHVIQKS